MYNYIVVKCPKNRAMYHEVYSINGERFFGQGGPYASGDDVHTQGPDYVYAKTMEHAKDHASQLATAFPSFDWAIAEVREIMRTKVELVSVTVSEKGVLPNV